MGTGRGADRQTRELWVTRLAYTSSSPCQEEFFNRLRKKAAPEAIVLPNYGGKVIGRVSVHDAEHLSDLRANNTEEEQVAVRSERRVALEHVSRHVVLDRGLGHPLLHER